MSSYTPYIERRKLLQTALSEAYPGKKGSVILFAGFEHHRYAFRQESTFYYFTGLEEPEHSSDGSQRYNTLGSQLWKFSLSMGKYHC